MMKRKYQEPIVDVLEIETYPLLTTSQIEIQVDSSEEEYPPSVAL